ncbi:GNAT family N-acetyltransferase [Stappia sp. TSB10P1A]|uniref:GNAT family N-acetyltransferase n=1 Tax=Stappia sp. TSB10P1A TaxID=2003585 RepID=UPI001643F6C1|nr:GNAT family N-acetyltransferase [Stappia sp. TSB10P1A]
MTEPTLRALALDELPLLIDWAAGEGWNPGLDDAPAFHAADPGGFLGLFLGTEMAAAISAVAYGPGFGFIGLYICRPDLRGKGLGRQVWDAGMARLGERCIGLDGVPAQEDNYRRMGFAVAYRTLRFSGHAPEAAPPAGTRIVPADPGVAAYDATIFPAPREAFLSAWISSPRIARMALRDGRVVGYGVARKCLQGWKIGPLFADTPADGAALLAALGEATGGEELHLDVPDTGHGFGTWLEQAGFAQGFATARMYRNGVPGGDPARVLATTTLELG